MIAYGLQLALSTMEWNVATSEGPLAADVVEHARRFRPDCVLLGIHHRNGIGSGIDLIEPLRCEGALVVMFTAERRRTVLAECIDAGAAGWISKGAALDEVDAALDQLFASGSLVGPSVRASLHDALREQRERERRVHETFDGLTEREALVLAALADGLCAEEIAREHFVAMTTIRSQIRAVLQKLGVRSQLAAVAIAGAHRELLPQRGQGTRERRRTIIVPRTRGVVGQDVGPVRSATA